jgi:hypothetical protein
MRMLNDERQWPVFLAEECMAVEEELDIPALVNSRGAYIEEAPENPMVAMTGPPCSICFRPIDDGGVGFTMFQTNESAFAHRDCIEETNRRLKVMGGIKAWENQWVESKKVAEETALRAKAASGQRGFFLELS